MKHWAIAVLCTACTINGKTLGTGSSSTPNGGGVGGGGVPASSMTTEERKELGAPDEGLNTGLPSYPSAPQDPWLAVDGDQPKRRARDQWTVRDTKGDCSAAHDHCLEPDTWFLVQAGDLSPDVDHVVTASVALFGPEGPLYASNVNTRTISENYVAFHTLPATRRSLVPGAIVFGIQRIDAAPTSGLHAAQVPWHYGIVESVDLDVGVFKLAGDKDTMVLSGARVAVFKWAPGGKVEILGGKARNQLAVTANDVFLPEK
jgi:hypothetical protein